MYYLYVWIIYKWSKNDIMVNPVSDVVCIRYVSDFSNQLTVNLGAGGEDGFHIQYKVPLLFSHC